MALYLYVVSIIEDILIISLECNENESMLKLIAAGMLLKDLFHCVTQINSLKITNYLLSSCVLIAICHSVLVRVCVCLCVRAGVYVWLVHLAEH